MKILIKIGHSISDTSSLYEAFIRDNVGKYLEVNHTRLRSDRFFLTSRVQGNHVVELSISNLDVENVVDDRRLGMSVCVRCNKIMETGNICYCSPHPRMNEFIKGSKKPEKGMDDLVDKALCELLPE